MKKLVMTMFMAAAAVSMLGQSRIIKGTVIDKKTGNYLPGTEISVVGGAESTVADSDGSFSIETGQYAKSLTARYAGMHSKKVRIAGNNMLIQMRKERKLDWFINAETGFICGPSNPGAGFEANDRDEEYQRLRPTFGLMGGFLGKWGCYMKCIVAVTDDDEVFNLTVGVTKRIFPWLHASLGFGGGLGMQCDYDYYTGSSNYSRCYTEANGMLGFEAGLIFRFSKHFNANIHYGVGFDVDGGRSAFWSGNYSDDSTYYIWHWGTTSDINHNLSVGIGYIF